LGTSLRAETECEGGAPRAVWLPDTAAADGDGDA